MPEMATVDQWGEGNRGSVKVRRSRAEGVPLVDEQIVGEKKCFVDVKAAQSTSIDKADQEGKGWGQ